MTFKIGDYVKHKEHPKNQVILHIRDKKEKEIINAQSYNFEHATENEIEDYHRKWFNE